MLTLLIVKDTQIVGEIKCLMLDNTTCRLYAVNVTLSWYEHGALVQVLWTEIQYG